MPIFEYLCRDCGKKFEAIVYGGQKPDCPHCHSRKLEQQLSVFAVAGGSKSADPGGIEAGPSPCGSCGHAGGPGACALDD